MPWIEVFCKNPRCRASFKVDKDVPSRSCHKCGTVHHAPWEQHDPRMEPPEDNHPPVLVCEGCFEEFDVRREPACEYQTEMFRCPKCGRDHSEKDYHPEPEPEPPEGQPEVVEAEPVTADGGSTPAALMDDLRTALDGSNGDGDLHVHFHTDG